MSLTDIQLRPCVGEMRFFPFVAHLGKSEMSRNGEEFTYIFERVSVWRTNLVAPISGPNCFARTPRFLIPLSRLSHEMREEFAIGAIDAGAGWWNVSLPTLYRTLMHAESAGHGFDGA